VRRSINVLAVWHLASGKLINGSFYALPSLGLGRSCLLDLINGLDPEVGTAISEHPDIDVISFTGSTCAGSFSSAGPESEKGNVDVLIRARKHSRIVRRTLDNLQISADRSQDGLRPPQ